MKLFDALTKFKGRGVEIPDVSRDDLPQLFVRLGYRVGAEIGVANGEFSEKICKAGLRLYSVDPWKDYSDYHEPEIQERLDKEYAAAVKRLAPYDSVIFRETSMEAIKDIEDGSLDFVYIDGHHGFKFVTEDIYEWSKKVRKGGIIAGHDYIVTISKPDSPYACHVKYVVDAYTKAFKIRNWYILGRKDAPKGEKRDKCRSWLWIKE